MNIGRATDKTLEKYIKRNPKSVKTGWIKAMLKKRAEKKLTKN